jgi:hypothetical protein
VKEGLTFSVDDEDGDAKNVFTDKKEYEKEGHSHLKIYTREDKTVKAEDNSFLTFAEIVV